MKNPEKKLVLLFSCLLFPCLLIAAISGTAHAGGIEKILKLTGKNDAVLVTGPDGKVIVSKNAEKMLVPASTLKIITSLAAFHYLGKDFRFKTEFYMDKNSNLFIKGYGDPLLISEIMDEISAQLARKINTYKDLILDNSYFASMDIPGVGSSLNPYDAPNGALLVNFNTVNFRRLKNGKFISGEPQTPLLPFALKRIKKTGKRRGRIVLSHKNHEGTLYAGHMFAYFFEKHGIKSNGRIMTGLVRDDVKEIMTYRSSFSMNDVISKLLKHSNNFIANQVTTAAGIEAYGAPGTLEKGVRALNSFAKDFSENIRIVEGSGISRKNRICAKDLDKALVKFQPFYKLMRRKGNEYYKTGTLAKIRTRCGYLKSRKGDLYRFVVMVNTPGKSTGRIMKLVKGLI